MPAAAPFVTSRAAKKHPARGVSGIVFPENGHTFQRGGETMSAKKRKRQDEISVDPEQRLAAQFDSTGAKKFPDQSRRSRTGPDVKDNCAQEHQM